MLTNLQTCTLSQETLYDDDSMYYVYVNKYLFYSNIKLIKIVNFLIKSTLINYMVCLNEPLSPMANSVQQQEN